MARGKQVVGLGLMVVLLGTPAVTGLGVRAGQAQATDPRKEDTKLRTPNSAPRTRLAQAPDSRKTEADRLLQRGAEQYKAKEYNITIQT